MAVLIISVPLEYSASSIPHGYAIYFRRERSVRHPKSDQLSDRWKKLWIDCMEYAKRLREMKEYLDEVSFTVAAIKSGREYAVKCWNYSNAKPMSDVKRCAVGYVSHLQRGGKVGLQATDSNCSAVRSHLKIVEQNRRLTMKSTVSLLLHCRNILSLEFCFISILRVYFSLLVVRPVF